MSSKVQVEAPRLWLVLSRCHRALNQIAERSIEEAGLCLTDFAALEALLHKGPLTITEIQGKVPLAMGRCAPRRRASGKGLQPARRGTRIRRGGFEPERKASPSRSPEESRAICCRSSAGPTEGDF